MASHRAANLINQSLRREQAAFTYNLEKKTQFMDNFAMTNGLSFLAVVMPCTDDDGNDAFSVTLKVDAKTAMLLSVLVTVSGGTHADDDEHEAVESWHERLHFHSMATVNQRKVKKSICGESEWCRITFSQFLCPTDTDFSGKDAYIQRRYRMFIIYEILFICDFALV